MAVATPVRTGPPDVRGPTRPLPLSILAAGAAALVIVLGGTLGLQIVYAVASGPLTPPCVAEGLKPSIEGARGVCHIVEALTSPAQSILLYMGIAIGLGAIIVGFLMYRRMDSKRKREQCITGAVLGIQVVALAILILWFRAGTPDRFAFHFLNFERLHGYGRAFLTGVKNTLLLALIGEAGGIVLGLLLSILALSRLRAVRAPARAYINFFRGTPLVWQLSVFYFGFSLGLGLHLAAYPSAAVVFILNTGAYAAEVFRAGIQSIERGQMEAARSLGMSYAQAMRYAVVPQAIRRVIPPLMNEFVILIKDTSLILVLGLLASELDIFGVARQGYSSTFSATFFVAAALGYLAVTLPLIGLVNAVERKLRSGLVGIGGAF